MTNTHSAAGAAIGYQYQADYCLFALLLDGGPGRAITLELHDDVAWEVDGTPLEKLQIKHTIHVSGGLGDKSPAMWRTIKAWLDDGQAANVDGPALVLVSTGTANQGSAAYALRSTGDRNPVEAAIKLRMAAADSESQNPAMQAAFAAFKKLALTTQNALVSRIAVVDGAPTIVNIAEAVKDRVWTHLPPDTNKHADFLDNLWGWWRGRVVEMLSRRYFPDDDNLRESVTAADLNAKLIQLTIAYSDQGLPEFAEFDVDYTDGALSGLDEEVFVHQLGFVKAHDRVVRRAIVDYYRATHSEVKWLERDFLRGDEVQRYERRLLDAWDVLFGFMLTSLSAGASDDEAIAAGQKLLQDVLSAPALRIRDHVDQDFYYRGKHHMMAQGSDLGWHPNFQKKVQDLLLGAVATL